MLTIEGNCAQCGDFTTLHFCYGCGKWICGKARCNANSVIDAVKQQFNRHFPGAKNTRDD